MPELSTAARNSPDRLITKRATAPAASLLVGLLHRHGIDPMA
jgi:hypothetical protein